MTHRYYLSLPLIFTIITSCASNNNQAIPVRYIIKREHQIVIDNKQHETSNSSQFGGLSITPRIIKDTPFSFRKNWGSTKKNQVGKINNKPVFKESISNSEIYNDTLIFVSEDTINYKYLYQGEVRTNLMRIKETSDTVKLNSTLFFKDFIIFNKINNSSFHKEEANYILQNQILPELRNSTEDKMVF